MFARPDMYGLFAPLQGGGCDPQILSIPSFSITIITTWSKKEPVGAGVAARATGICPDEKIDKNARRMTTPPIT